MPFIPRLANPIGMIVQDAEDTSIGQTLCMIEAHLASIRTTKAVASIALHASEEFPQQMNDIHWTNNADGLLNNMRLLRPDQRKSEQELIQERPHDHHMTLLVATIMHNCLTEQILEMKEKGPLVMNHHQEALPHHQQPKLKTKQMATKLQTAAGPGASHKPSYHIVAGDKELPDQLTLFQPIENHSEMLPKAQYSRMIGRDSTSLTA